MKTYYYSVATAGTQSWSDEKQYECSFSKWNDFASFCKTIATSQKTQVRGCETSGYNNQGHYFN